MATLSQMLQRGYSLTFAVTIEGIPYILTEAPRLWLVSSAAEPALPSGYSRTIACLAITEGQTVSIDADRRSGVASGSALDITLAWAELEDENLLGTLFREPQAKTLITADLDAADTTVYVGDTTGFPASGGVYIGRERIGYSGKTGTTLTGCTRGVAGYAYDYESSSPTYRWVTDRPLHWRGRFVTLHAHLVSPEGRLHDATWLTGTTHFEAWKGYIDEPPTPGMVGMTLRCLPLVRLAGQEIGLEATGPIAVPPQVPVTIDNIIAPDGSGSVDPGAVLIRVPVWGGISFSLSYDSDGDGASDGAPEWTSPAPLAVEFTSISKWASDLDASITTLIAAQPWYSSHTVQWVPTTQRLKVRIVLTATYTLLGASAYVKPDVYWLVSGTVQNQDIGLDAVEFRFDRSPSFGPGWWLPVLEGQGQGWQDFAFPPTGHGVIKGGAADEVIRWGARDATFTNPVLLRIDERGVGATSKIQIDAGQHLSTLTGTTGTVGGALLTLLESSGTGLRGAADTLELGFGLGVPESWIDTTTTSHGLLALQDVAAISDGRSSVADLLGGWLALLGRCLVQRTDTTSGTSELAVVSTMAVSDPTATSITTDNVLVSGVSVPVQEPGPNEIRVERATLASAVPVVVRDRPRIQAEGARSWTASAPSMEVGTAVSLASSIISLGTGQQVIEIPVAPWLLGVQVGDAVSVDLAHPITYDYADGSRAPATIPGRVVGWRLDLHSGARRLRVLLAGTVQAIRYLCPTATIGVKNSATDFDLGTGEGQWFTAGDSITLYEPGNEATREEIRIIDTVTSDNITITVAASAWVGVGSRVTYPDEASATTTQDDYAYHHADTIWGP